MSNMVMFYIIQVAALFHCGNVGYRLYEFRTKQNRTKKDTSKLVQHVIAAIVFVVMSWVHLKL
jgi:hypothetical protein